VSVKVLRDVEVASWRSVDNPVAQKLLVKQLQRYDLNVIATSNGEEAIAGN